MRIFSNVTMSSNVSMASNAKDSFTIDSEMERDNPNADEFKVWANSNFYNDVTLGSSSVDIVTVNAQLTASNVRITGSLNGTASYATNVGTASNYYTTISQAGGNSGTTFPVAYGFSTSSIGKSVNILSIKQGNNISLSQANGDLTVDVDQTAWSSYNVSWTSSGTQPSLGNGILTGYYKQIGKTVFVRVKLEWGSTTTGGTGDWRLSLPVSAVSSEAIQMPCSILDNGNAWYQATVNGRYSGLTDRSSLIGQSSLNNSSQGITSTFPITWGDGDSLQFNGSYEAA